MYTGVTRIFTAILWGILLWKHYKIAFHQGERYLQNLNWNERTFKSACRFHFKANETIINIDQRKQICNRNIFNKEKVFFSIKISAGQMDLAHSLLEDFKEKHLKHVSTVHSQAKKGKFFSYLSKAIFPISPANLLLFSCPVLFPLLLSPTCSKWVKNRSSSSAVLGEWRGQGGIFMLCN